MLTRRGPPPAYEPDQPTSMEIRKEQRRVRLVNYTHEYNLTHSAEHITRAKIWRNNNQERHNKLNSLSVKNARRENRLSYQNRLEVNRQYAKKCVTTGQHKIVIYLWRRGISAPKNFTCSVKNNWYAWTFAHP